MKEEALNPYLPSASIDNLRNWKREGTIYKKRRIQWDKKAIDYYFVYLSINGYEMCYTTSKSSICDFRFRGTIVSKGDIYMNGRGRFGWKRKIWMKEENMLQVWPAT
ncbi:hypothetical protein SAMN05421659_10311 [[Clostridium] fimetarium]|uniref:Uncharacterized protein n=2 Tax=[Clostridium] fimetarium TaxID=99656 RepID=A0A1I0NEK5_9FIRM|nr:hypothetical protein SAMN05421659_10311 [[Clostridium] fimetarium]